MNYRNQFNKINGKSAAQIFEECKDGYYLIELTGNKEVKISKIGAYEFCDPGDLVFVSDEKFLETTLQRKPSAIVVSEKMAAAITNPGQMAVFISENAGLSYATMMQKYNDRNYSEAGWERVHPSAIVHESVKVPEDAQIGPNVVIEKNVKLGAGVILQSGVVIEHDAVIGAGTIIQHHSVIGFGCEIGKNCLILPLSVIGSEGFGYSQDKDFNHYRIPQTGNVEIGDKVTIGALNAIDRATFDSTRFADGVICDNVCHTAHNVQVGKNSILLTGWKCAGSSKIGSRVIASGDTMVKDHVNICDDTIFVHRGGVITDITEPGMYAGSPTQPMRQYVKNLSASNKISEMAKELKELRKAVADLLAEK